MFIDKNGMIDNGGSLPFVDAMNKAFKDGTAVLASQTLNGPDTRMALQPNPSNKQFDIAIFGVINGQSSLEIVDMQGKVVYQSQQLSGKMTIPSQDWSEGVYLVRLSENGQVFQKKFVKN
jgi:hypothetical protein